MKKDKQSNQTISTTGDRFITSFKQFAQHTAAMVFGDKGIRSAFSASSMIKSVLIGGLVFQAPASSVSANGSYDPASEVDVELLLAVDISQSMDTEEQEIQRAGYVTALTSDEFLDAIQTGPLRKVAIMYMEWGGVDEHFIVADWAVVHDMESASHFASKIAESPLRQVQRTSLTSALEKGAWEFQNNKYTGLRQVIDISGDGPNNQGGSVTAMRDRLVRAGITINGLPLMMKSNKNTWQAMLNLDHYYEDCVIGGPHSFAIPVRKKEQFPDALRKKLVREIAFHDFQPPVPDNDNQIMRDFASLSSDNDNMIAPTLKMSAAFGAASVLHMAGNAPVNGQAHVIPAKGKITFGGSSFGGREKVRCNLFD